MSGRRVSPAVYAPRRFTGLGLWLVGDLTLKAYGVTWRTDQPGPPASLVRSACEYGGDHLPLAAEAEGHHGLGSAIVHEGRQANWLLLDWWAHDDICCQILAQTAGDETTFRSVERPLHACVWESVVLAFERDAWVETMLTNHPDAKAYLSRRLPGGTY